MLGVVMVRSVVLSMHTKFGAWQEVERLCCRASAYNRPCGTGMSVLTNLDKYTYQ